MPHGAPFSSPDGASVKTSIWTPDFVKLTAMTTLLRICTQIQITSMPLFFHHLGGSHALAGLSMTFFTLSALMTRPIVGVALDTYGRRSILLGGTAVYMVSTFLYGFVTFIPILILLRILHGISFSASSTASSTMASDILPEHRMTEGLSYFGLFGTLAVAVAPTAALTLLEAFGYSVLYGLTGIVSLIAFLIGLGIRSGKGGLRGCKKKASDKFAPGGGMPGEGAIRPRRAILEPRSIPPSVVVLFVSLSASAVSVFLPTFAIHRNIDHIGLFFVVQAAALALSRLFIGPWSARTSPRRIVAINLVAQSIALAGIGFSHSLWELLGWAVLFGFANGCLIPQLNAIAVTNAGQANRGKANATFYVALDFGIGVGAACWGLVLDGMEAEWIFILAAILPAIALLTPGVSATARPGRS